MFSHNIASLYPDILDKHVPSSLINKLTTDIVTLHCVGHVVPAGRGVKVASAVGPQLQEGSSLFPRPSAVADLPGDTMQLS